MKYLTLALLLTGCGLFSDDPVKWPEVARCGQDVHKLAGPVLSLLLNCAGPEQKRIPDEAREELEDYAREHGPETVACVVGLVYRQLTAEGAEYSPETLAAAARARDFLDAVGTRPEAQ